jgi:hypothetical protein
LLVSQPNFRGRLANLLSSKPTVTVLLPIQGISLFLWWVAGSYLGFDVFASRSYWSLDGLCNPSTQGLGVHCWSDYYALVIALESGNPYFMGDGSTLYPAASLAPFVFFKWLTDLTGVAWLGLAAYLSTMTALISYSVWVATNHQSFEQRVLIFSTLVFLSPPVLVMLDRGNSVGFLIPILIWLFTSIRDHKSSQTVFSLALLSVIKPHYGVLALAFVLAGRRKEGSQALGIGLTLNILPFLVFWPREFPNNIYFWATTFFGYQEYGSVNGFWPQNISFSQSIYILFYTLHVATGNQLQPALSFIESRQGLWGFLVLFLVIVLIFTLRKKLTTTQVSIIVVSAITMTSSISYYYYTVVAIPFLLILQNSSKSSTDLMDGGPPNGSQELIEKKINFALWCASILTLVQFPVLIAQDNEYTLSTVPFIGGVWIICYLYIFVVNVRSREKSQIPKDN